MPDRKPDHCETNEHDKAVATKQTERRKHLNPSMKIGPDGLLEIEHGDNRAGHLRLLENCGTGDLKFFEPLLNQLASATGKGQDISESDLNFALSVIADVKPKDQLEAMLAAQMACVHIASMTFARRLAHTETIAQQDSAQKGYTKLLRTFTNQMEALRKYRNGGQQTVTVQHVQVNEGGQAIVGNVDRGGGAANET